MSSQNADDLAAWQALSEREKAAKGFAWHGDLDDELTEARVRAKSLFQRYNAYPWPKYTGPGFSFSDQFGPDERKQLLADLFGISMEKMGHTFVEPPFFCDYGTNIEFGDAFYCNVNCCFLDGAKITFGDRCAVGPGVQIFAGTHSSDIGDDVWIGGGVQILPGAVIGNGCTVAAGSVVRGSFPDNVVIGGVPARILKQLDAPPPMGQPGSVVDKTDPKLRTPLPGMAGRDAESVGLVVGASK
ncbi:hypothetical protein JCM8097_001600 [Rhodosporidiobolus ruineniae]